MRRFVLECQACPEPPRFRTSPLVVGDGVEGVPGINAASRQLAEHTYEAHGAEQAIRFESVEMPETGSESREGVR